jgi:hypothetical protein
MSKTTKTEAEISRSMNLPAGKTCKSCRHFKRTCGPIGYSWSTRTQCDFYPNLFQEIHPAKVVEDAP